MEVLNITPVPYGGPGPTVTVARFHLSLSPEMTLRNWNLRRKPDGRYIVAAPKAFGDTTVYFTSSLAKDITAAAVEAFERHFAVDHRN